MRTLVPWLPRNGGLFEPLREEMEEMFGRFFAPPEGVGYKTFKPWMPRLDIEELEREVVVKVDLPGIDAKDVEVTVVDGSLILRGEKKEVKEEKRKNFHRVERFTGGFYREVPLPVGIEPEKITATSAKGVVTITIPKKPEVHPKKIMVKPLD
jgi:HSP20 family protein